MPKTLIFLMILFIGCSEHNNKNNHKHTNSSISKYLHDTVKLSNVSIFFSQSGKALPENIKDIIVKAAKTYFHEFRPLYPLITINWENRMAEDNRRTEGIKIAEASVGFVTITYPRNLLERMDSIAFYSIMLHELTHTQKGPRRKVEPFTIPGSKHEWKVTEAIGLSYIVENTLGYEALEESTAEFISFSLDSNAYYQAKLVYPSEFFNGCKLLKSLCKSYHITPGEMYSYQVNSSPDEFMSALGIHGDKRRDVILDFTSVIDLTEDWKEVRKHFTRSY